ncbi:heavy-metal-associated domain-containing protein [Acidiphilium sp. AL]|uniref:Heavy-metal-associated domain-containing protein n=1 Tax=Acidiphilium iwatense TaxID=768198 RepID=A0ABS9DXG1_9PROT|nr:MULTISPECIES: heavy-metal-associated domain-containing protein [Acidiphilium]MCF3946818.1 heavy-metal-associated domain-containing protein [Acidiphilium iwatense]MCU4160847.1 heavy-metal-associated domain-containing protein [Acidiphilium sp. AL]
MTRFKVPDMECNACVASITKAVQKIDAKADVAADLAGREVAIASTATPQMLRAAIEAAGFTVGRSPKYE